jgi:SpoVK/Ycf46/Vps4 family AAA+-type ATPase
MTRQEVISTFLRSDPHNPLDLDRMARDTEGYTGADMECVGKESVLLQLTKNMSALSFRAILPGHCTR